MGDLIGFEGYLNTTTPFTPNEHKAQWKSGIRYRDFDIKNDYKEECEYPRFWQETGYRIFPALKGCYDE
jgi:alpha-1,3-glucan synthase